MVPCRPKLALLLAAMAMTLTACNPHPAPTPEPRPNPRSSSAAVAESRGGSGSQSFDYYLLNLSWSPEFCHSHPDRLQCQMHSTFILHGLWPQRINGGYPESCSAEPGPRDPSKYQDIYLEEGLLQHEWKTHGTCSGLAPDAYFSAARQAYQSVKIPERLQQLDRQISMPPDAILGLFTDANPQIPREALALSCGNNYLTAVEVCLDTKLKPMACGPIRSCRANTVRIPPPR